MRAAHNLLLLLALVVQSLWAAPSASWPGESAPAPRCRCCACGGTGCCATQAPSDSPVSSPVAPLPSRSEGDHEVPFPPALPSSLLLAAPASKSSRLIPRCDTLDAQPAVPFFLRGGGLLC